MTEGKLDDPRQDNSLVRGGVRGWIAAPGRQELQDQDVRGGIGNVAPDRIGPVGGSRVHAEPGILVCQRDAHALCGDVDGYSGAVVRVQDRDDRMRDVQAPYTTLVEEGLGVLNHWGGTRQGVCVREIRGEGEGRMIKYLCDEAGCGKELNIISHGRIEPNQFSIELKHPDGTLIMAKIESMNKPPNKVYVDKQIYSDPVKHICSECLAKKVSESEAAVIV